MIRLVTEYPIWLSVLCLAFGAIAAYLLYGKLVRYDGLPAFLRNTMAVFRFLAVTILSFLLLSPLLKTLFRTVEKPVIVIAQDNSASLNLNTDSIFLKGEYSRKIANLTEALHDKYQVVHYLFGQKVEQKTIPNYKDKVTNMEQLIEELETRYVNRNLGAVIISSDGLYNEGENPLYESIRLRAPIYTIAMGDTTVKKDFILAKVNHNKTVYTGNSFPLEILMQAQMMGGKEAKIKVEKDGKVLFEQHVKVYNNRFSKVIPLQLKADGKGTLHYIVRIEPDSEELSVLNNVQHIFIDVISNKQKVLILADAPHPDIAAIRQTINKNENYESEFSLINDFNKSPDSYNLIILHQLPSLSSSQHKFFNELQKSSVSRLFITGYNTVFNTFNKQQNVLQINGVRPGFSEVTPVLNNDFSLFSLSESTQKSLTNFAPLVSPFGTIKLSSGAAVLFQQRINMISTTEPLIAFNEINGVKTGVVLGEGLWRWRLSDYQKMQNHNAFQELMGKIIQYMSVKTDKRPLRVNTQNIYHEGENIFIDAKLYNESEELTTQPDVKLIITDENNKQFNFQFSKNELGYFINIPSLPVGTYTYQALTNLGNKQVKESGSFIVKQINIEALNTAANHQLLNNIAHKTQGQMVYPNQLEKLEKFINSKEDIVPVSYTEEKLQDLINLKLVFFILIALLSVEWFLRKRYGGY